MTHKYPTAIYIHDTQVSVPSMADRGFDPKPSQRMKNKLLLSSMLC